MVGVVFRNGALDGAADHTVSGGAADSWYCVDNGAADRTYVLDETAETLQDGMRTRVWKKYTHTYIVHVHRYDGAASTELAQLDAGFQCAVDLVVRGGRWCVESMDPHVTMGADPGP